MLLPRDVPLLGRPTVPVRPPLDPGRADPRTLDRDDEPTRETVPVRETPGREIALRETVPARGCVTIVP